MVKKAGLLVFSLLFALFGLELVLRLVPPREPTPDADRSPMFYDRAEARAHPWTVGASNVLRIAVIGDSFTVGVGVQTDDTYGARLERLLNFNAGSVPAEVRVYAHPGTSTFQQKPLLQEALAQKPAIVIQGICLNDFEDWSHPKKIQRWRAEWMHEPSPFQLFCVRHSRVAAFIGARLWAARSPRRCETYYRHLYDPNGAGALRFKNTIEVFRDACAANGAVFVPVVFPLLSFDFSPERYPMSFAHDAIRRICDECGVPCLDLLPAFRGTSPERMQAVPGVDPHPSEIAHHIAAEAILNHLLERGLVDETYRLTGRNDDLFIHAVWKKTLHHVRFQPDEQAPAAEIDAIPVPGETE